MSSLLLFVECGCISIIYFQWDLICDRRHLKAMTQAVFMVGLLFGSVVFSVISDRFGRKVSLFASFGFVVSTISFQIVGYRQSYQLASLLPAVMSTLC